MAAGYDTQLAFANALGISEGSVANAERGASRVGNKVFTKIEGKLGWPNICMRYIETGDESLLPGEPDFEDIAAFCQNVAGMSYDETHTAAQHVRAKMGQLAARAFVRFAVDLQELTRLGDQDRETVSNNGSD